MNKDQEATLKAATEAEAQDEVKALGIFGKAIYQKELKAYSDSIWAAKNTLAHTITCAYGTNIDYTQHAKLNEWVEEQIKNNFPAVFKAKVQDFLTKYDKLLMEFPELRDQAYNEGLQDGQNN